MMTNCNYLATPFWKKILWDIQTSDRKFLKKFRNSSFSWDPHLNAYPDVDVPLKYYIAGSFATHLYCSEGTANQDHSFPFNDIDIFVHDTSAANNDEQDGYTIVSSYKTVYHSRGIQTGPNSTTCNCFPREKRCPVNFILVKNCRDLSHLIAHFDINCCQVGYELDITSGHLSEPITTQDFNDFLLSKMLKVVKLKCPAASLLRMLKKHIQLSLPFHVTPSLVYALIDNTNELVSKDMYDNTFKLLQMKGKHELFNSNFDVQETNLTLGSHDNSDGSVSSYSLVDSSDGEEPGSSTFNGPSVCIRFRHANRCFPVKFILFQYKGHNVKELLQYLNQHGVLQALVKDDFGNSALDYLLHWNKSNAMPHCVAFVIKILENNGLA